MSVLSAHRGLALLGAISARLGAAAASIPQPCMSASREVQ